MKQHAKPLIKGDLIERVYRQHGGISRSEAKSYVETLLGIMIGAMERGERITVKDFGSFRVVARRRRRVKLPDGSWSLTRGLSGIRFLPAPALKKAINGAQS